MNYPFINYNRNKNLRLGITHIYKINFDNLKYKILINNLKVFIQ